MARSRPLRALRLLGLGFLGLLVAAALSAAAIWYSQGGDADDLDPVPGARVEIDAMGIPTISAPDWDTLIEAQGYVTAAHRLWQMDLMRRSAGGGLAAWFGEPAVAHDSGRLREDWQGVADRIASQLPGDERSACDHYAAGVNRFITENTWRWGIEYVLTRTRPEPWACRDSVLILLAMAEDLSQSSDEDAASWAWRKALDPEWSQLLFAVDDPWNEPLFGENTHALRLPDHALPGLSLPQTPAELPDAPMDPGSNSWAWRGKTGTFLANDPHLGANVPHLWFLVRLRVSAQDWVVGTSIPGIPAVVLGMNPHLAWAFTNTGEDVDDFVLEQVSEDGSRYLAKREPDPDGGAPMEVWEPVEVRHFTLQIKGGAPVQIVARFTARGPLAQREELGGAWASRSWLPFQDDPAIAHLPSLAMAAATDLESFHKAADKFRFPAQNILVATREGDLAWRASGTGILRGADGAAPLAGPERAWRGLAAPEERPRLLISAQSPGPVHLETANARTWVDGWNHGWASDRRTARIRELLSGRDDLRAEDMERFQLDTKSRYHQLLVQWAAARATPVSPAEQQRITRWRSWDGFAATDPRIFTEALAVEATLKDSLLVAVRRAFPSVGQAPYLWSRESAWILEVLGVGQPDSHQGVDWAQAEQIQGFAHFGLDEGEVANAAVAAANRVDALYPATNRWAAQHPFVGRVPVLGAWFRLPEPEQWGYPNLVRTEKPRAGASARLVWDLSNPTRSSWITPVGQSGHVRSRHFRDLATRWHSDQRLPVFDTTHDWGFASASR